VKEIALEDSWPSIGPEDIARVERRRGIKLPDDYRLFLLRHNGGRPERDAFPIVGDPLSDGGLLDWLYCIHDGDQYDLVENATLYRGRMPPELLPIGEDPGSNQICLAVTGPSNGKVYFWDREEEAGEDEKPTYENIYFIANSFTEMIGGLYKFVLQEDETPSVPPTLL
jgi:hypothetical protein